MKKGLTTKRLINALEIVEQLVADECQSIEYDCSGDKDTHILAFTNILNKYGENGFYDVSNEMLKKYETEHGDEITEEYNKLVEFGKIELPKTNIVLEYVRKKIKLFED